MTNPDRTASGDFDVVMTPAAGPAPAIASLILHKTYRGSLAATAVGQMLSAGEPAKGVAGYVAVEQVTGTLDGHRGSFALQHSGTMLRGGQSLAIAVVPGSGTEGLAGILGTMTIDVAGGQHHYTMYYTLP